MTQNSETGNSSTDIATASAEIDLTFGDGDLGTIQGILLGGYARQTSERIGTLEAALLGVIADLRSEMDIRFEKLSKQIAAESQTRTTAVNNVVSRHEAESNARVKAEQAIRAELENTRSTLDSAINKTTVTAAAELSRVRAELAEQLQQTDSSLRDNKVDRETLAGLFEATIDQLRGQEPETSNGD